MQPSPNGRRVGIRIVTFEACSGFTRVTAHRIAQPSKTAFVTRLQPCQLPNYVGVFSFARSRVGTFRKEMEAMKTEADWEFVW